MHETLRSVFQIQQWISSSKMMWAFKALVSTIQIVSLCSDCRNISWTSLYPADIKPNFQFSLYFCNSMNTCTDFKLNVSTVEHSYNFCSLIITKQNEFKLGIFSFDLPLKRKSRSVLKWYINFMNGFNFKKFKILQLCDIHILLYPQHLVLLSSRLAIVLLWCSHSVSKDWNITKSQPPEVH